MKVRLSMQHPPDARHPATTAFTCASSLAAQGRLEGELSECCAALNASRGLPSHLSLPSPPAPNLPRPFTGFLLSPHLLLIRAASHEGAVSALSAQCAELQQRAERAAADLRDAQKVCPVLSCVAFLHCGLTCVRTARHSPPFVHHRQVAEATAVEGTQLRQQLRSVGVLVSHLAATHRAVVHQFAQLPRIPGGARTSERVGAERYGMHVVQGTPADEPESGSESEGSTSSSISRAERPDGSNDGDARMSSARAEKGRLRWQRAVGAPAVGGTNAVGAQAADDEGESEGSEEGETAAGMVEVVKGMKGLREGGMVDGAGEDGDDVCATVPCAVMLALYSRDRASEAQRPVCFSL